MQATSAGERERGKTARRAHFLRLNIEPPRDTRHAGASFSLLDLTYSFVTRHNINLMSSQCTDDVFMHHHEPISIIDSPLLRLEPLAETEMRMSRIRVSVRLTFWKKVAGRRSSCFLYSLPRHFRQDNDCFGTTADAKQTTKHTGYVLNLYRLVFMFPLLQTSLVKDLVVDSNTMMSFLNRKTLHSQ